MPTSNPHPLKLAREAAGLSVIEFASRAGVGRQYIYQIDRGRRPIPAERVAEWAKILGCRPVDLVPDPLADLDAMLDSKVLSAQALRAFLVIREHLAELYRRSK